MIAKSEHVNVVAEYSVPQMLVENGLVESLVYFVAVPAPEANQAVQEMAVRVLKKLFVVNGPAAVMALKHFSTLDVVVSCVLDSLQSDLTAFPDLQKETLDFAISSYRRTPDLGPKFLNAVGLIIRQDFSLVNYILDRPKEAPRAIRLEALLNIDSTSIVSENQLQKLCRSLVRLLNETDKIVQAALYAILNLIQGDPSALTHVISALHSSSDKENGKGKAAENIIRVITRFQDFEPIISKGQQLLDMILCE